MWGPAQSTVVRALGPAVRFLFSLASLCGLCQEDFYIASFGPVASSLVLATTNEYQYVLRYKKNVTCTERAG